MFGVGQGLLSCLDCLLLRSNRIFPSARVIALIQRIGRLLEQPLRLFQGLGSIVPSIDFICGLQGLASIAHFLNRWAHRAGTQQECQYRTRQQQPWLV